MKEYSKRQFEILKKSIELISEKGIQGLTVKNLAERIGISEPALYRHFKNKFEILKALLNLFKTESEKSFEQIDVSKKSSLDKIELIYDIHIIKFFENPPFASVVFSEELFKNDSELSTIVKDIMAYSIDHVTKIVEEGQKNGEINKDVKAKDIAIIILGSLRLLIKEWCQQDFSYDLKTGGENFKRSIIKLLKR